MWTDLSSLQSNELLQRARGSLPELELTSLNTALLVGGLVVGSALVIYSGISRVVGNVYTSVKPQTPTKELLEEQRPNAQNNALFKLFPQLQEKIAWVSLGTFPSFIDVLSIKLPHSNKTVKILLKREDLSNTRFYGGNKVRTLEYQIACAKIQLEALNRNDPASQSKLISMGGPGSNQIVATSVFGRAHGVPVFQYQFGVEGASFDNSLNLISHMSFPNFFSKPYWLDSSLSKLSTFYKLLINNRNNDLIGAPGGNNVTGALGHVNAILELAQQLDTSIDTSADAAFDAFDASKPRAPKHIFLALGSSCTTAGLTAGLALIRKLGLGHALHETKVHAVAIHHMWDTMFGRRLVPWIYKKVAGDVLKLIRDLTGLDATQELETAFRQVEFVTKFAGQYGEWSDKGIIAKYVMESGQLIGSDHELPWVCSCFTSKSSAAMIDCIEAEMKQLVEDMTQNGGNTGNGANEKTSLDGEFMFWCTKSRIQPLLDADAVKQTMQGFEKDNKDAAEWLKEGHVRAQEDYLDAMKKIV